MSNEAVEKIDEKAKELQLELNNKIAYLNSMNEAIKKLRSDRKITISDINKIAGAIEAFNETTKFLKSTIPDNNEVIKDN